MVDVGTRTTGRVGVGDLLPAVRRTISRTGMDAYRAVSGDNNRIHYDDEFAADTRFGGVIAHGMLTLTLVSEMMATAYGADWLTSGSLRARFRGAARPGDTLEASGVITKNERANDGATITCNVEVNNTENGDRIITGTATVRVAQSNEGMLDNE